MEMSTRTWPKKTVSDGSKADFICSVGQIWTKVKGLMQPRDEIKDVLSGQRIDGLETRNVSAAKILFSFLLGHFRP